MYVLVVVVTLPLRPMNEVQSNFHCLPLLYPFELDLVLSWMNEILVLKYKNIIEVTFYSYK